MHLITLGPGDEFAALREQLLAGRAEERTLILVSPGQGLARPDLTLVLLRRLADREGRRVGLVSDDRDLRRQAMALGLPAFRDIRSAEQQESRWDTAPRREIVGFAPGDTRQPPAMGAPEPGSRQL